MKQAYINCRANLLSIQKPLVAGILNLTPDSFFDGGKYTNAEAVKKRCAQMIEEGADFIDVGAVSTRPGASVPSQLEEMERLLPALDIIKTNFPDALISLDTFRTEVAYKAFQEFGIDIINDISAGEYCPELPDFVAENNLPYIIMHKKGMPADMQKNPTYNHVIKDLLYYFSKKLEQFRSKGIQDIIIDPGFGFGKTLEHNYGLLENLHRFEILETPVMVGLSAKSMIYKFLGITPAETLTATNVLHKVALEKQADILRVHHVKEAKQTIELHLQLSKYKNL